MHLPHSYFRCMEKSPSAKPKVSFRLLLIQKLVYIVKKVVPGSNLACSLLTGLLSPRRRICLWRASRRNTVSRQVKASPELEKLKDKCKESIVGYQQASAHCWGKCKHSHIHIYPIHNKALYKCIIHSFISLASFYTSMNLCEMYA